MPVITVGVDPGLKGAVAVLERRNDGTLSGRFYDIPVLKVDSKSKPTVDTRQLTRRLISLAPVSLVVVEAPLLIPSNGKIAAQKTGFQAGMLEGILTALNEIGHTLPYTVVHPQTWKKVVLEGTKRDKQAAVLRVSRMFPHMIDPASRPDIAEAFCMAEYGLRILVGSSPS